MDEPMDIYALRFEHSRKERDLVRRVEEPAKMIAMASARYTLEHNATEEIIPELFTRFAKTFGIDLENVVRCRDCAHASHEFPHCLVCTNVLMRDTIVDDYFFCADGKRRDT